MILLLYLGYWLYLEEEEEVVVKFVLHKRE